MALSQPSNNFAIVQDPEENPEFPFRLLHNDQGVFLDVDPGLGKVKVDDVLRLKRTVQNGQPVYKVEAIVETLDGNISPDRRFIVQRTHMRAGDISKRYRIARNSRYENDDDTLEGLEGYCITFSPLDNDFCYAKEPKGPQQGVKMGLGKAPQNNEITFFGTLLKEGVSWKVKRLSDPDGDMLFLRPAFQGWPDQIGSWGLFYERGGSSNEATLFKLFSEIPMSPTGVEEAALVEDLDS